MNGTHRFSMAKKYVAFLLVGLFVLFAVSAGAVMLNKGASGGYSKCLEACGSAYQPCVDSGESEETCADRVVACQERCADRYPDGDEEASLTLGCGDKGLLINQVIMMK